MVRLPAEYITKEAAVAAAVAGGLGKFLTTIMPNAFKAIRAGAGKVGINELTTKGTQLGTVFGKTITGPSKTMLTTTGIGMAGGAAKGAYSAPEGEKGKGALKGALVGGVLGAGAGAAANKLPTLGNKLVSDFTPAGQRLIDIAKNQPNIGAKELFHRGADYAAKNMGTQWRAFPSSIKGPEMKNFFGGKTPATHVAPGGEKSWLSRAVASGGQTVGAMREKGILEGGISRIGDKVKEHTYFTAKSPSGNLLKGERSGMGKIIAPLAMSGAGMGVMEAAQSKNPDGTQRSMTTRLRKGVTATVGWSLAAPAMGAKSIYDATKALRPKKLQQNSVGNMPITAGASQ